MGGEGGGGHSTGITATFSSTRASSRSMAVTAVDNDNDNYTGKQPKTQHQQPPDSVAAVTTTSGSSVDRDRPSNEYDVGNGNTDVGNCDDKQYLDYYDGNEDGHGHDDDGGIYGGTADTHADECDFDPGPGCRPFCSSPFGHTSSMTLFIFGLMACALSLIPIFSCHYMTPNFSYCFPEDPDPRFWYNNSVAGSNGTIFDWEYVGPEPTCFNYTNENVGLFFAEVIQQGTGLSSKIDIKPGWFQSWEDLYFTGFYGKCHSYNYRNSVDGFWNDVKNEYFGPVYVLAATLAGFAMGCGLVVGTAGCMVWCVAFSRTTIRVIFSFCIAGGIFEILTLIFMSTDVCQGPGGCQIQFAGVTSIVASIVFFIVAIGWYRLSKRKYDKTQLPISCCCCPQFQPVKSGGITEVVLQRTYFPDGSVVLEKTTIMSTGFKSISRTTCLPDCEVVVDDDNSESDEKSGLIKLKVSLTSSSSNNNSGNNKDCRRQRNTDNRRRRSSYFSPNVFNDGTKQRVIVPHRKQNSATPRHRQRQQCNFSGAVIDSDVDGIVTMNDVEC